MEYQRDIYRVADAQLHLDRILEAIGEGTKRDKFVHGVLHRMNESQEEDGEPRDRTMIALLLQLDFPRFQDDDALLRDAHAVMDFYLDPRTQADTASMIRAYTPALVHLPNPCEQGGLAHGWGPASPNLAAPAGSSSGDSTEAAIVASAPSGMYIDS
jgi:hypothetical protein